MDRQTLRNVLRELVEETTGEPCGELTDGQDLRSGVGLDSVDLFSLVVEVQSRFGIKISSEELGPVANVGSFLDLVQSKLPVSSPAASAA